MKIIYTLTLSALALLLNLNFTYSQDTAKIMSYNILNYSGQPAKELNFRKSLNYAKPDILCVQEIISENAMNRLLTEVLNYYTPNVYSSGTFIDGPDTDNAIFYKNAEFTYLGNQVITTDLRDINMYTLYHMQSRDTIRILSVHLKASPTTADQQRRLAEVNFMRAVTNALPTGSEFMVLGDFNIYNADEPAYIRMLQVESGNEGHFIDPYVLPGVWNQSSYSTYHSQSTRTRSIGDGGATGGMDDRFDFILNSKGLTEEGKVKFVPNSLKPFGNDGNHYNDSINKRPNTSVPDSIADALYYGSDHLPVYAMYKFDNNPVSVTGNNSVTPQSFTLEQNYPNPFNPVTVIRYELQTSAFVNITIFDSRGRTLESIVNSRQQAGTYSFEWDASNLPSGNYYYRLTAGGYVQTKSMMLVK